MIFLGLQIELWLRFGPLLKLHDPNDVKTAKSYAARILERGYFSEDVDDMKQQMHGLDEREMKQDFGMTEEHAGALYVSLHGTDCLMYCNIRMMA